MKFSTRLIATPVGDCDDMTALYTSLLESVGIETALIPPGPHGLCPRTHPPTSTLERDGKTVGPHRDHLGCGGPMASGRHASNKATVIPAASAWQTSHPTPLP